MCVLCIVFSVSLSSAHACSPLWCPSHSSRFSSTCEPSYTSLVVIPRLFEKAQFAYIRLTETPEEGRRRRRRQVQEELQLGRHNRFSENRIRGVVERR
jgi:hypothetical protein